MSKPRKLSYDMEEPAFLRRLRAAAGGFGQSDRHIAPRNRRTRIDDDEDDEPMYVLESGNEISKKQFKALEKGEDVLKEAVAKKPEVKVPDIIPESKETIDEPAESTQRNNTIAVAEAGTKKKRKAPKIIDADEPEDGSDIPAEAEIKEKGDAKRKTGGKKRRFQLSFEKEE